MVFLPGFFVGVLCVGMGENFHIQNIQTAWAGKVTKYIQHKVEKDDTVSKIARAYGSNVDALKKENTELKDEIKTGQKIMVPVETYEEKTII